MRYFAIGLETFPKYHFSGKSVNVEPMKHSRRTLRDFELFFVTDGTLWIEQGEEYGVQKGEVLMHAKGEEQAGTKYASNAFYWFHFDGEVEICETEERAREICEKNEKWIFFAETFALRNVDRVLFMLTELNHYRFEENDNLVKDCLTAALLSELANQYGQSFTPYAEDKRFAEIIGWLGLHATENVSLTEVAERFDYNPKYLSALFKKFTGGTAKEWLTNKRIALAKRLLTTGTESVKRVAFTVGFNDEYYFMRVFKKAVGMTPKKYRKAFCGCAYT